MRTLIIINPNAAGGRAAAAFKKVENRLVEVLGEFVVAVTKNPQEVTEHLDTVAAADISRLVAIGGDGTNHAVVNALAQRPDLDLTFGSLPVGTGRDWARSLGIPSDPVAAVEWLARGQAVPCDFGKVEYVDTRQGNKETIRTFLNIASAGVSGEVDARVNRSRRRTSLTFLGATIATLFQYKPQRITVDCDGKTFYSGSSYLVAVANGRCFGRGMWIAPQALINDGKFDVVLVEGMPRLRILAALRTVFSGKHLKRDDVHHLRASEVQVHSEEGPLSIDLDGEETQGQDLRFTIQSRAIKVLVDPTSDAVLSGESSVEE
ncbi:MAG: YegS/Rv2252/BmrU family lipid kinase [Candidatus Aminicenantes bacterium]|nr:YegS/Rv2252/BmrU family lipid kinase [Candidatus Aminicenantes bacterium]